MSLPNPASVALARGYREHFAGTRLVPAHARLYSQFTRLSYARPGLRTFGQQDAIDRLSEATALLTGAFLERDAGEPKWADAAKRAAELFEWLSHKGIRPGDIPLELFAAGGYQLAGYPALASGMLASSPTNSPVAPALLALLKADFSSLFARTVDVWRNQPALLRFGQRDRPDLATELLAETCGCLGLLAAYMRWGEEERLRPALEKLHAIAAACMHGPDPFAWLSAKLCAAAADEYSKVPLWQYAEKLGSTLPEEARPVLSAFVRRAYLRARSLAWPSQRIGLERLLAESSFVLCTPTGSGKTLVAELAILTELLRGPTTDVAPLALYLVPSRALAAEVEQVLSRDFASLGGKRIVVSGLYGGIDWGPTDAWLTSSDPTVCVCTYEKAEALVRFLGPLVLDRLVLVVLDEAHGVQVADAGGVGPAFEQRSLRLESLGLRLLQAFSERPRRFIALSAVASGGEKALAQWVSRQAESVPALSSYRSTRQLLGRLECRPDRSTRIYYDVLDRQLLRVDVGDEGSTSPFIPEPLPLVPLAPSVDDPDKPLVGLRPYLFWTAFHLASAGRTVLVSVPSQINSYAETLLTLLEDDWNATPLPTFFTPPTGEAHAAWSNALAVCKDYFTDSSPEYRLLARGVVVHHGGMPAALARRLKDILERRVIQIVVATSTLSEGVNLPVEYILVPSVYRGETLYPASEFANLIGRAGRPGTGTEGHTLVLVPPSPPNRRGKRNFSAARLVNGYVAVANAVVGGSSPPTPRSALAVLLETLWTGWQSLAPAGTPAEFYAWLEVTTPDALDGKAPESLPHSLDAVDGILLATVEELQQLRKIPDLTPAELEDGLRKAWTCSFARVVAANEAVLQSMFVTRGRGLVAAYPDRAVRRQLYGTGMPPSLGKKFLGYLEPLLRHLSSGTDFSDWTADARIEFVATFIALISDIPHFAPPLKEGNSRIDWRRVLAWWLSPETAAAAPNGKQASVWHAYISKWFAYKGSWALGCVMSLSLPTAEGERPAELTLDTWAATGLPWSVFWLKELLVWGTVEPVAAFLLARGRVVTRSEAMEAAQAYYRSNTFESPNEALNPRRIRDWADVVLPPSESEPPLDAPPLTVSLVRPPEDYGKKSYRVVPVAAGDQIQWCDLAGYVVATSLAATTTSYDVGEQDFELSVKTATVRMRRFA